MLSHMGVRKTDMEIDENREIRDFRQLIADLRRGSDEAAWKLVELYGPHIHAVVRKKMGMGSRIRRSHDTADFVQAAWASLVRGMPQLKEINEPKNFVALMATIACRRLANEVRKKVPIDPEVVQDNNSVRGSIAANQPGSPDTPSQIAIARERWNDIMGSLSDDHRRVINMRLRGKTFVEIAAEVGIHERTVRRIIKKATEGATEPEPTSLTG